MKPNEITAVTLLLLHTWMNQCVCDWYSATEGTCSRCYTLQRAEQELPQIYEAFRNTITTMENSK